MIGQLVVAIVALAIFVWCACIVAARADALAESQPKDRLQNIPNALGHGEEK